MHTPQMPLCPKLCVALPLLEDSGVVFLLLQTCVLADEGLDTRDPSVGGGL